MCGNVLQCVAVSFIAVIMDAKTTKALQCVAVCYSVLQCVVVCCSVMQWGAVCCSVSQRVL